MIKLLICTHNENKINEIKGTLLDLNIEVVTLKDLNDETEVIEDGLTFQENAYIKASYFGHKHQLLSLSDDSGLEVEHLNGGPGVYSARFAGNDLENNKKLLYTLTNVQNRNAQFKTVLALYNPNTNEVKYFEGTLKGKITEQLIGRNGFGYDPVFYVPEIGKTLAELTKEEKLKVSHRGKALEKLKEAFNENFNNI
ncbi:MAG: RdgB/HAM1 family non-canonical purine NTP pyrophosphatase [Acholeplasmatales bacterium]|jgi:XTP/dITP diphosphohydrolase|nr:RdgB/HAM1 family non-canonical purine NTP pyrophosphatase [Acholeplasmatales bacterium]